MSTLKLGLLLEVKVLNLSGCLCVRLLFVPCVGDSGMMQPDELDIGQRKDLRNLIEMFGEHDIRCVCSQVPSWFTYFLVGFMCFRHGNFVLKALKKLLPKF